MPDQKKIYPVDMSQEDAKKTAKILLETQSELIHTLAEKAKRAMEERYAQPFTVMQVSDITNPFGAKILMSPENVPEVLFVAQMEPNGTVQDNYVAIQLLLQLKTSLEEQLEKAGVNGSVSCVLDRKIEGETNTSLPLSDFLIKHRVKRLLTRLIISRDTAHADLIPLLEQFFVSSPAEIAVNLFLLRTEQYTKWREDNIASSLVSEALIQRYEPDKQVDFLIMSGHSSLPQQTLQEKLEE